MRVLKWLLRGESYWLAPYERWGIRRGFAESLRWIADKIGPEDAFTRVGGAFANRVGVGRVNYYEGPSIPHQEPRFGTIGEKPGVDMWCRVSDYKEKGWEER